MNIPGKGGGWVERAYIDAVKDTDPVVKRFVLYDNEEARVLVREKNMDNEINCSRCDKKGCSNMCTMCTSCIEKTCMEFQEALAQRQANMGTIKAAREYCEKKTENRCSYCERWVEPGTQCDRCDKGASIKKEEKAEAAMKPKPDYNNPEWEKIPTNPGSCREEQYFIHPGLTKEVVVLMRNPMPEIKPGDSVNLSYCPDPIGIYKVLGDVAYYFMPDLSTEWFCHNVGTVTKICRPGEGVLWERK